SKKEEIEQGFVSYETIKVLTRLCSDYKLLNEKQYEYTSKLLIEIGALLGGWYKPYK
ncbi:four helix bundle protein, partial [bacterium (Candidatus Gribaldobacteria) CG02_land_8_20_14_3_00_41_15]